MVTVIVAMVTVIVNMRTVVAAMAMIVKVAHVFLGCSGYNRQVAFGALFVNKVGLLSVVDV